MGHKTGKAVSGEASRLPDHPLLATAARALDDAGQAAVLVDHRWHVVYATDDVRRQATGEVERADMPIGGHLFSREHLDVWRTFRFGPATRELQRVWFSSLGGVVLNDTPGGQDELRDQVHPGLRDLVGGLEPEPTDLGRFDFPSGTIGGPPRTFPWLWIRLRDSSGLLVGTVLLHTPQVGLATISALTAEIDPGHLERSAMLSRAERRPTAVLMVDLEGSSALSRRLSTSSYFTLARRLVGTADRCVVEAGGIVGRHVGDGVTAFFLAEQIGSESGAARACVAAARNLVEMLDQVAERSGLQPDDLIVRAGLHWGSTLYVGNIASAGRTEVTAMGDEVNEAARIEACATGGRLLASKSLLERLTRADASALGLDPDDLVYTALADLPTATEKARRDAPNLSVCDVAPSRR